MYYKEFLRARNAVLWYCGIAFAITMLIAVISALAPVSMQTANPQLQVSWALLFAIASFGGAIVATMLCSALSKENDGHLEIAWTKPVSRTKYASVTMAVDAAGIIVCQLVSFALILSHVIFVHHSMPDPAPDTALQLFRFAVFPLAWYGLLVALSASLRGQAGIVQGLSWVVAFGLIGGLAAPLPAVLHFVVQAVNYLNPLIYASYTDDPGHVSNGMQLGASFGVAWSAAALTAIAAAAWFAAVAQWRRLQA